MVWYMYINEYNTYIYNWTRTTLGFSQEGSEEQISSTCLLTSFTARKCWFFIKYVLSVILRKLRHNPFKVVLVDEMCRYIDWYYFWLNFRKLFHLKLSIESWLNRIFLFLNRGSNIECANAYSYTSGSTVPAVFIEAAPLLTRTPVKHATDIKASIFRTWKKIIINTTGIYQKTRHFYH